MNNKVESTSQVNNYKMPFRLVQFYGQSGRYQQCFARLKSENKIFRSVSIAFGFIGEFILRRSNEVGSENWGKAISCDPPQFFPGSEN